MSFLRLPTILTVTILGIACAGGDSGGSAEAAPDVAREAAPDLAGASSVVVIEPGCRVKLTLEVTADGERKMWFPAGAPFAYLTGSGQLPAPVERELLGRAVGEEVRAVVEPEDGYGTRDPDKVQKVAYEYLDPGQLPDVGTLVEGTGEGGAPFRGIITEMTPDGAIVDANHPLAGKTLSYSIRVTEIVPPA